MGDNTENHKSPLGKFLEMVGLILAVPVAIFTIINNISQQPTLSLIVAVVIGVILSVWLRVSGRVSYRDLIIVWLLLAIIFILFALWPRTMDPQGRVVDSTGQPVVNEMVKLFANTGQVYETKTDGDGLFQFSKVPMGKCKLQVRTIEIQAETDQYTIITLTSDIPTPPPTNPTITPTALAPIAQLPPMATPTNVPGGEIAVIVKDATSSFWQNVGKGAYDAQKELKTQSPNLKVTFLAAKSYQDANGETDLIKKAVSSGVKAIVIAPIDNPSVLSAIKTAANAGIKIFIIDGPNPVPVSDYISFLSTDNRAAGAACAKELINRIKEKTGSDAGKIAVISYIKGAETEVERVGGFSDYISANSQLKIVTTQYSNNDSQTATRQTMEILSNNPDLVGIFGANEPTAEGMGYAIAQAGFTGKIVAIGFDGSSVLQGFIYDGILQAIGVQNSYRLGYLGVKTAYEVASLGQTVPKTIDNGILIVTQDNIDSQEAKNVLY